MNPRRCRFPTESGDRVELDRVRHTPASKKVHPGRSFACLNYVDHGRGGFAKPNYPVIFARFSSSWWSQSGDRAPRRASVQLVLRRTRRGRGQAGAMHPRSARLNIYALILSSMMRPFAISRAGRRSGPLEEL